MNFQSHNAELLVVVGAVRTTGGLHDCAACRYVNTPSAYDTAVYTAVNQLPILFLPVDDIVSRRFLSISFLY